MRDIAASLAFGLQFLFHSPVSAFALAAFGRHTFRAIPVDVFLDGELAEITWRRDLCLAEENLKGLAEF